ncbi:pentatricopeptide repeat-containing protein [Tanacetum coccineum]
MSRVLPPKLKKMPGRPRKKRIRAAHESKNTNRLSRAGVEMTCQNCGKKGHNKAGCTNAKVDKPPKPPGTKGRPKKYKDVESTSLVDEPDVAMDVIGGSATFEVRGSSAATSRTKRGGKRVKFNTNARPDKVGKSMFVTMREGIGKRGRLAPSTRLGRFGLNERQFTLDTIENSDIEVPTSQRLHNDTIEAQPVTQRSQTTRMQSNLPSAAQVTPTPTSVQVNPIGAAGSFVRPRGKSQRILKNKLEKKHPCAGSSKSNAENLE